MLTLRLLVVAVLLLPLSVAALAQTLPGTDPLTGNEDLAKGMVEGLHAYLDRELEASAAGRAAYWHRDLTDGARYEASVAPNRERLRRMIGVVDARAPVAMRLEADVQEGKAPAGLAGTGAGYKIYRVRWNVFRGVEGEGLLLVPNRPAHSDVVALPDCDAAPEQLAGLAQGVPKEAQFARRLAESGCRVLVPALIDRSATYSGNPAIAITNQPHREFLYRAAYEMGRHILGYEVQKVLAAVDWFQGAGKPADGPSRPLGVIGFGEGGLVALYSAALDTRIGAAAVSGCFAPRERMPREPIYRNVFGLLREFGDAEIACLVAPRPLIVEASRAPEIAGPPETGRRTAASGTLTAYSLAEVQSEFRRAVALTAHGSNLPGSSPKAARGNEFLGSGRQNVHLRGLGPLSTHVDIALSPGDEFGYPLGATPKAGWRHAPILTISADGLGLPGAEATLSAFLTALNPNHALAPSGAAPKAMPAPFSIEARRKRQFQQIADDTQVLMHDSPLRRKEFWSHADFTSPDSLTRTTVGLRDAFWDEILGRLPTPTLPANPKSRQVYDTPKFTGYEVKLDLYPGVFAYGILLVPKGIPAGERRPVVVCQHGLEGRAQDVADPAVDSAYYHRFACRLAEKGYITFAPQNPYIDEDRFRTALRKAQPLKLTLFSFIVRQHEAILKWLGTQPNVDAARIAFYGLSYGGKTAMRVPAALPGYCLSICSGDYNEWVWKCSSTASPYSYLFTGEYDMPEWNLANTFNYAEMSWLICPRPFMVERGHGDGVAPDDWVAYEYAHTRRAYDLMGLADRTELEFFNGPHTIHGVGTFQFLDRHLKGK